jgi:hypothetical protein
MTSLFTTSTYAKSLEVIGNVITNGKFAMSNKKTFWIAESLCIRMRICIPPEWHTAVLTFSLHSNITKDFLFAYLHSSTATPVWGDPWTFLKLHREIPSYKTFSTFCCIDFSCNPASSNRTKPCKFDYTLKASTIAPLNRLGEQVRQERYFPYQAKVICTNQSQQRGPDTYVKVQKIEWRRYNFTNTLKSVFNSRCTPVHLCLSGYDWSCDHRILQSLHFKSANIEFPPSDFNPVALLVDPLIWASPTKNIWKSTKLLVRVDLNIRGKK